MTRGRVRLQRCGKGDPRGRVLLATTLLPAVVPPRVPTPMVQLRAETELPAKLRRKLAARQADRYGSAA